MTKTTTGSRTAKTAKNAVVSLVLSIATLLLNYISRVIFVQYLDASYLGINGLFTNIITIFSLADLGLSTAMMFSFYKPLKESDELKITQLVSFFRKVYLIIAAVVLVLGLAFTPVIPYVVNLPENIPNLLFYYIPFVIETASSYLFVYKTTLLSADQRSYWLNSVGLIFEVVKFALRMLALIIFRNYFIYISVGIATNIVGNFSKSLLANHFYPFLKKRNINPLPINDRKDIVKNVKSTFIYRACIILQNNTDNVLISIMVGTISVGIYSNYLLVVNGVVSFIGIVYASIKASVGSFLLENEDPSAKRNLFEIFEKINVIIVGLCCYCFFGLFDDFILVSYGQEYLFDFPVLFAIIWAFYTVNIKQNTAVFRETTGIFSQVQLLQVITTILNLGFSILLGYFFGVFGILFATSVSRVLYAFWKEPAILYKEIFRSKPLRYEVSSLLIMIFIMASGSGIYFLCKLINLGNLILDLFIKLILCVCIGAPVLSLLNWSGVKYVFERIRILLRVALERRKEFKK